MPDFDAVMREHGPMLARIAASHEADPARREDLLQDIGIALWRALPAWRGDSTLRTFVARVAQNRAVDHAARQAAQRAAPLDEAQVDATADPARAAEHAQRRDRLLAAIRRLGLGARQAVVLSLEGFSQREIAETLGIEENAVAQRLSRARRELKQMMEDARAPA